MDIASTPKILAAALIGATVATTLPRQFAKDTVLLRFEWAGNAGKKASESLVLRASLGEPTIVHQGARTVEVQPTFGPDGDFLVRLQLKDASRDEQEALTTSVHAQSGETLMIMGRTKKDGKSVQESMLFLTVSPV